MSTLSVKEDYTQNIEIGRLGLQVSLQQKSLLPKVCFLNIDKHAFMNQPFVLLSKLIIYSYKPFTYNTYLFDDINESTFIFYNGIIRFFAH